MKRFVFRLDPVLRYRDYQEKLALMDVAKSKRALAETMHTIDTLGEKRKTVRQTLGVLQARGISVKEHRLHLAYLQGLDAEIAKEEDRAVALRRTVREKQRAAETERIKKETLETIRDSAHKKHMESVGRAEQKALDELESVRKKAAIL